MQDNAESGLLIEIGVTEIAMQRIFDEDSVLDRQRLIQSQLLHGLRHLFLGGVLGQQQIYGVSDEICHGKDQHGNDHHDEDHLEKPLNNGF